MIERYLRAYYQKIMVDPFLNIVANFPINPSHFTIAGCLLGIGAALLIGFAHPLWALLFLILSGYLDTLDGSLARLKNQTSKLGTVLDIICDRIVEFSIIVALFSVHQAGYLTLFMLGAILLCITSFLVVAIFTENNTNKGFYYSPGLVERAEAFIFFGAMICLPQFFDFLAYVFIFLVFLTSVIRICQFKKHCP